MNIKRILREELYRQYNIDNVIKKSLYENINKLILNESQESKSQSKAIKLAMQNGMDRERAEQFVRMDLRNDLSELRHSDTAKFTLGCARLFFERQLTDAKSIALLNQILGLITSKYYDKFDQNLNGVTLSELSEQFSQELEDIETQNRNDVNGKQYVNQGYKIVPINSYEEAQKYNKYCYYKSPWCITYIDNMWDSYTKSENNQVYFCLKNSFENMEAPKETGNFKDEYGLSMISVIVDENGKLAYSTTRWNHANGASGDHDLTVQEISDIVGVNFYETFKPNSAFKDSLNDVMRRLKMGEAPKDVFNYISDFKNGFAIVSLKSKFNFIDDNGNILSDQWFDSINYFENGFAIVRLRSKYNFIDTNGNILSDQWFDDAKDFEHGLAKVLLDDEFYVINRNGKLTNIQGFRNIYITPYGALVSLNDKWNMIDNEGNIMFNDWYDNMSDLIEQFKLKY